MQSTFIKGQARSHILATAATLFYRQGIRATGIDQIIAETGIAKKTFYYHFASKDALIVAYIEQRDAEWRTSLPANVAARSNTPVGQLLALFDVLAERFTAADFRGCAFTNTIVETANREHPAHAAALAHKDFYRSYINQLLAAAGVNDPQLGYSLLLLVDGALVTALREGTPTAALMAKHAARILLHAAGLAMPTETDLTLI
ncbi:TetR/AcrR family transcriptional regulator [Herpetosiphon llansteffanensis]